VFTVRQKLNFKLYFHKFQASKCYDVHTNYIYIITLNLFVTDFLEHYTQIYSFDNIILLPKNMYTTEWVS
jgi:hypothetical protein